MGAKSDPRRFAALLLAPPVIAILMGSIWSTEFVRELENVTIDWRFKARADSDPAPDPQIALIGIGDLSLDKIGRWQDWGRGIHGEFLTALTYRPPQLVAFDLFFPEPSKESEEDIKFSDALAFLPGSITGMNVLEGEKTPEKQSEELKLEALNHLSPLSNISGDISKLLGGESADLPIPVIAESSYTGAVNFPPSNVDGMRREIPLVVRLQGKVYPSLVLQIILQKEEADPDDVLIELGQSISVPKAAGGAWEIPIDERGFHYLNYRDTERFTIVDYFALFIQINRFEAGEPWPDEFPPIENQILIVGQSATGLSDFGPTPYRAEDPLFAVQATVLDSILREDYIRRFPLWLVLTLWTLLASGTLIALRKAPIPIAIAVPVVVTGIFIATCFLIFKSQSILLPFVLPVVGFVAIHTTMIGDRLSLELKEKKYIRGVFGSYVAPDIVNEIISSGKTPELGGEKVNITILFSDIQGFSTFSEQLTPEALVELMVEYLSALTDIVTDSGGTLDKYIGDAIDAMFGAPLPLEGHAYKGVLAAIEMQRKQTELDEFWKSENRPEIVQQMRTRIGLNTGAAVVGNMGSKRRFNYTMMGDNVNLGARCESAAKSYGVYTMITEDTYTGAREVKDDITYRYLDQIIVQGRTLPVKVYEVFEQTDLVSADSLRCIELYEEAYRAYLSTDWDKAISLFEKSSAIEPFQPNRDPGIKTNPSQVMIARCGVMKVSPPDADWDGVYRMTTK
ncbi:MAG: adenylate/guanylate cyclase domain-containing protein [Verrucomicrobiales bacterium]|nr:adenylate/guanylate cyclase domain-containing protein [Verrucomicrobiales bacterium]